MDIRITKRQMAIKMLAQNEPIDKIVEYTGLWKASVEQMKREMGEIG